MNNVLKSSKFQNVWSHHVPCLQCWTSEKASPLRCSVLSRLQKLLQEDCSQDKVWRIQSQKTMFRRETKLSKNILHVLQIWKMCQVGFWIDFCFYTLSCSMGMQLQLARSSEEEEEDKDIVEMNCHQQDMKPANEHPENKSKKETRRKELMR